MLPRHDHEQEGYIGYNTFYFNAKELNVTTKVGKVKNVSGPLVQVFLIPAAFTVVTELK